MNRIVQTTSWLAVLGLAAAAHGQQPSAPTSEPSEAVKAAETDPVVLTIIESNPTKPAELIQAAESLLDFNRPELSQGYLKKLIEAKPNAAQLVQLHREFGSRLLIRLSMDARVQPEGRQVADAVLKAADRWTRDPRRINALIQTVLTGSSTAKRGAALYQLQTVPTAAVTPLMRVLQSAGSPQQAARARGALASLGPSVVEPLIGFLRAPEPQLQTESIWILGRLEADRAAIYLLRPYLSPGSTPRLRNAAASALQSIVGALPTASEAQTLLKDRIDSLLAGHRLPSDPDQDGRITVWRWDAKQQTATPHRMAAKDAAIWVAANLAYDLHQLWPERSEFQRLYLVSNLEAAQRAVGPDQTLPRGTDTPFGRAVQAGPEVAEQVLVDAIRTGCDGAAMAALEALGEIGDRALLTDPNGHPRPLASGLTHPNPRVRMAAARAIMRIDPKQPYPGASQLIQLCRYLISTGGTSRALVASPNGNLALKLSGYLRELGLEVDQAITGRQVQKMAAESPDYDFLLIRDSIEQPLIGELLQHLRQHPYPRTLPIGLLAQSAGYARAEQFAQPDPTTVAFPIPQDREAVASIAGQLIRLTGPNRISANLRIHHASEALTWLEQMASDRRSYGFYDVVNLQPALEGALVSRDLSSQAARVMAQLGTPQAQAALLDLVAQNSLPLAQRRAAADALVEAIRRKRVQLAPSQIMLQYQRYQQPGDGLDSATRQLLGVILSRIDATARETSPDATD